MPEASEAGQARSRAYGSRSGRGESCRGCARECGVVADRRRGQAGDCADALAQGGDVSHARRQAAQTVMTRHRGLAVSRGGSNWRWAADVGRR